VETACNSQIAGELRRGNDVPSESFQDELSNAIWTAIPMLIGAYAKRTSVQRAFFIAGVCAVLLTALSLALHAWLRYR
jgi:hypothetical protein